MIETVIEFTKVKDIDIKDIYADMEVGVFNLDEMEVTPQYGNVVNIDGEGETILFNYIIHFDYGYYSEKRVDVSLYELSEDNLEQLIGELEDLLK